ncbi:MAG: 4Fe-4S dicluster domain-containing protein [Candidatus Krumholzibacteriota bacterium]
MSDRVPPLYPWPLDRLLRRVATEWEDRSEIFGLAGRRFFRPDSAIDLGCDIAGRRVATPVGPAAGPHTQLAQNIALAWLAGGRTFELKTVQILDELDIERPCIDMENVGYNIEWSQELTLDESLVEYAKSALLLAVLRRWEPLAAVMGDLAGPAGDHTFELSAGYDLAGIRSDRMTAFFEGMLDARTVVDRLREDIPAPFGHLRDVPVETRIFDHVTLSTFHGCPPDEIEGIVEHMMTAHDVDVTVKLNPTLLGMETVREILHERLGHTEVPLVPDAFAADLQFDRALEMINRLEAFAASRGREFGVKLTNTLVVGNRRGVMPGEQMYLSGKPLHVMAITLLDKLVDALPGKFRLGTGTGPIPVAFSAGIDKDNLAAAVALGLAPVTICSDLLKPGGYGRMAQGLRKLVKTMKEQGLPDLGALRGQAEAEASTQGHRDAAQEFARRLATSEGSTPYALATTGKPLRQVDHQLEMFDCVACTNCVTVCPNNAFLQVPSQGIEGLEARAQYLVLAELCNDCGNCTTFCPEVGAPHLIKPRLYFAAIAWEETGSRGFLLDGMDDGLVRTEGPDAKDAALVKSLVENERWLKSCLEGE